MNKIYGIAIITTLLLSGCSYAVNPVSISAGNIYSTEHDKIPGTWVVVTDESMENISREVSPSGYDCSVHKFPVNIGSAVTTSVKRTMRSVFENMVVQKTMPDKEKINELGASGTVFIKLDTFEPRISCSIGFLSGSCTGISDIEFGVIVRKKDSKRFATSVVGSAKVDGDSGRACEGATNVLSEAISKSIKKALEQMGDQLSNSTMPRKN